MPETPLDELLLTRLLPPPLRPALVARPRLGAALAFAHPLTLLVAPAGSGKTTALAQTLAAASAHPQRPRAAWLSLDVGDNDQARFWRYVLAALERAAPGSWARAETILGATGARPAEPLLIALLNCAAALPAPVALVLDDYHLIAEPAIHAGVTSLVERAPPQLRLVIATRERPPLPLARFAVAGLLLELDGADLRFTVEEAGRLLGATLGLELDHDAVAALVARTEGWGAGLILAALAARGRPDPTAFAASFGGASPAVLDYVTAEILARQPPELRAFLLATAPLPRFSAELCDALLGPTPEGHGPHQPAAQLLARVGAANLFLVPLDDEGHWFRYHHLFADALRTHLARVDPAALRATRLRAAAWLAPRGAFDEAIALALAAEDWTLAARLIGEVGRATLLRSEVETLRGWLKALPPEVLGLDRRLAMLDAWMRVLGSDLDAAAARAAAVPDDDDELRGEALMLRTTIAVLRGQLDGRPLDAGGLAPEEAASPFLRAMAALNRGFLAQYAGEVPAALAAFAEVARASEDDDNTLLAFIAACQTGEIQLLQGRPREAAASYEGARARSAGVGQTIFAEAALAGLGAAAYEQGQLDQAAALIEAGLSRRTVLGDLAAVDGLQRLAAIAALRGERAPIDAHLGAADAIARALGLGAFRAQIAALRARLAALAGDRDSAAAWLASDAARPGPDEAALVAETIALARAAVLAELGRHAEALAEAEAVVAPALAAGRGRHAAEANALRALALAGLGRLAAAREALEAARAIADPHGLVAVFLEAGPELADLLPPRAGAEGPDELTEREVEVLRLVAAGHSNGEIAERLVVAPSTVKKHINRIFAKLGATSRTQALVRARERGVRL